MMRNNILALAAPEVAASRRKNLERALFVLDSQILHANPYLAGVSPQPRLLSLL